jgi:hypothetical protein
MENEKLQHGKLLEKLIEKAKEHKQKIEPEMKGLISGKQKMQILIREEGCSAEVLFGDFMPLSDADFGALYLLKIDNYIQSKEQELANL